MSLECTALGGEPSIVVFAWDVTEQHHSKEQLAYLAYTDSLTGLANRALFADRLHQAVRHARSHGTMFAVLMLDLDGFKAVNDTFGHEMGDVALQLVGQRFQGCVRDGDTLARIGGDEFAVLLPRLGGSAGGRAGGTAHHRLPWQRRSISARIPSGSAPASALPYGPSMRSWAMPCWRQPTRRCTAPSAPAGTSSAGPPGESATTSLRYSRWPGARHMRSAFRTSTISTGTWSEQIDQLSAALEDALDSDAILARLNDLVRYAEFHFAAEELTDGATPGARISRDTARSIAACSTTSGTCTWSGILAASA